jgi:hypothetical protein
MWMVSNTGPIIALGVIDKIDWALTPGIPIRYIPADINEFYHLQWRAKKTDKYRQSPFCKGAWRMFLTHSTEVVLW